MLDSSAVLAVLMEEPEKKLVLELTKNAILIAPNVLDFEIGNALSKMHKRHIITETDAQQIFLIYKSMPINYVAVNIKNSIKIFCKYVVYAYDAYYLEVASRLEVSLLTFDASMKFIANDLSITVLEE